MIHVNGAALKPLHAGALWWGARATLIVSDLHLEKGSAFAGGGALLPPYDTRATLSRVTAMVDATRAERVISLGDSIHDARAPERMHRDDIAAIRALTGRAEWIWISGNHDPDPPAGWGGIRMDRLTDGPLVFRHAAEPGANGEISGHYHPKGVVRTRAKRYSGRCFVHDGRRLIMPAFGAYTGGLNVCDPAIASLMTGPVLVDLIAPRRLVRLPLGRLSQDQPRRSASASSF